MVLWCCTFTFYKRAPLRKIASRTILIFCLIKQRCYVSKHPQKLKTTTVIFSLFTKCPQTASATTAVSTPAVNCNSQLSMVWLHLWLIFFKSAIDYHKGSTAILQPMLHGKTMLFSSVTTKHNEVLENLEKK